MFGGIITKDGTKSNELFWLSTDRMEWHNQITTGAKPCPRDGHCAVYDELKNMLVRQCALCLWAIKGIGLF
jgi:hypothetical protein